MKGRYKWDNSYVDLYVGAGHDEFSGTISSGFKGKNWGAIGLVGLAYHKYYDRQFAHNNSRDRNIPIWFNDTKIYAEMRIPLSGELKGYYPWGTGMNSELYPEFFKVGSEVTILDLKMGKNFLLPIGFELGTMMYDFDDFKSIIRAGLMVTPFLYQERLGKIYAMVELGGFNVGSETVKIGVIINFDYFIKAPSRRNIGRTTRK